MEGREVEFSVLGPVSVRRDGADLDLGPRLRRVLAILLVHHGDVVSTDRLIDAAWEGNPPAQADKSLKTYVTRLRRSLDPDRQGLITFSDPGYVLSLNGATLDSEAFDSELDVATRQFRSDADATIGLLSTALDRWHGAAFAGFADQDWARPEAVRLEERRLEAAELMVEARLASGDAARAVSEAQSLARAEPFRERPRELLMRALYTTGRQAEALREFQAYREFLIEESGLDPSPGILELDDRIARSDASLAGAARRLRGYELRERIGQGAHAVVHRAVQPGVNREVAIKIIRPELADRPEFIRRFELEAQAVAAVEHPHVVPLYDYWREPGAAYLVMRLLRGGSVEDAIRSRGPFSRRATIDLIHDIGGALQEAHRKGVVHRDVRPANLLLDEQGAAYLADFGIALPPAVMDDTVVAAPAYAAPELLRGEPVGAAADVLSLGVTTFEVLTGRLPFADSGDRAELIRRQLADPLPSARSIRTDLPAKVDEVLARATTKVADDRHATVAAFVADLTAALEGEATARPTALDYETRGEPENPYLGLQAFQERDADRFYGREVLVTELVEALESQPFVVAVGPSGSGKSSAVRAGLIPAIRCGALSGSESWFVTTMVPGADPIDALETALLRIAVNPPASLRDQLAEPGGLLRAVRRVLPDDRSRLLVVIDQLEELFTMVADEDQDRLLAEIAHAVTTQGSPLRVVATLRADHYDVPLRNPSLADLVSTGTVTVRPMTPAELERVIVKPAHSVGVEVEPALVADLVAGASESPAALPLLQFALTECFERRISRVMLASVHQEIGGLTGAVAARADRIVDAGGDDEDEAETRRIFGRLVTLGDGVEDTRRRALRSELGEAERTAWLLDAFTSARLLTLDRDEATREPTIEVAHEALLKDWPRLAGWLAEDRDDLRLLRTVSRAAVAWIASDRDDGELGRSGRLEAAQALAQRRPDLLNTHETEWIEASTAAAEADVRGRAIAIERDRRQNRRLRQLLVAALVLTVVAGAGAGASVIQRNRARASEADALTAEGDAEASRANADIERLSALSTARIASAPDLAILLALEANRRRDDVATQTALHRAIASQPSLVGLFPNPLDEAASTSLSRDGQVAVVWSTATVNARLAWHDAGTGGPIGTPFVSDVGINDVAVSGDGSVAAVALVDGSVRIVDANGGEIAPRFALDSVLLGISLDRAGQRLLLSTETSNDVMDVGSGELVSRHPMPLGIGIPDEFPVGLADDGMSFVIRHFESPTVPTDGSPSDEDPPTGYDLVDADTGALKRWVPAGEVTSLGWTQTGRVLVGQSDGVIRVDDTAEDSAAKELGGAVGAITAAAMASDGTVATASGEGIVQFWAQDGSIRASASPGGDVDGIAFARDGMAVVSLRGGGRALIDPDESVLVDNRYERSGGNNVSSTHFYYEELAPDGTAVSHRLVDDSVVSRHSFADVYPYGYGGDPYYSSDGKWALAAGWDVASPVMIHELEGDRTYEVDVATAFETAVGLDLNDNFRYMARPAPGGERLFFAARDLSGGPVHAIWIDTRTGAVVAGPLEMDSFGPGLVLDDGRVVMGHETALVSIVPAALDQAPVVVPGADGFSVFDLDRSSGRVLIGAADGRVGLVDVDAATVEFLEPASGALTAGAFSPTGKRVAVLSTTKGVQILDVATGKRIGVQTPLADVYVLPLGLQWSEDGTGVWVGAEGGPIRLAADPSRWRAIACGIVHRELTADEWTGLVSASEPQVSVCN